MTTVQICKTWSVVKHQQGWAIQPIVIEYCGEFNGVISEERNSHGAHQANWLISTL